MSHMNIFSCDAMLSIAKNIIGVEMTHHLRADDVFNHIRSDRCQRNMAIVATCGVVSLLGDGDNVREMGTTFAFFHSSGTVTC